MKKVEEWKKEIKANPLKMTIFYICVTVLCIIVVIGLKQILKKDISQVEEISEELSQVPENVPKPDRIVYKLKEQDGYYIWQKGEVGYQEILSQVQKVAENLEETKELSQDEVEIREAECANITLDYDRISKNYLISLEADNMAIIKYKTEGGVVVKDKIEDTTIQDVLQKQVVNKKKYYKEDGESNRQYESTTLLEQLPENYQQYGMSLENGIYQAIIEDKQTYDSFAKDFSVSIQNVLSENTFENSKVVVTVSKGFKVKDIRSCIGNIKYKMISTSDGRYHVNIFVVSRIVNSNCIYKETEIDQAMMEEGYRTKDYLSTYNIISNSVLTKGVATTLGLEEKEDNIYVKKIETKEELQAIGDKLKLQGVGSAYIEKIENVYNWDNDSKWNYIMVLKNTTGHFEASLDFVIPGSERLIKPSFTINTHELKVEGTDSHIEGMLVAIPKEARIEEIKINQMNYETKKFENNVVKITKQKAVEKAKEYMNLAEDNYTVYPDIRSKTTALYGYDVVNMDNLRRVWIVCGGTGDNYGNIFQVVVDATTGEVLDTDELGC